MRNGLPWDRNVATLKRPLQLSTTFCDVALFCRPSSPSPFATLKKTTFFRDAVFLFVALHRHSEFRVKFHDGVVTAHATLRDGVTTIRVDVIVRVMIHDDVMMIRVVVTIHRDVF